MSSIGLRGNTNDQQYDYDFAVIGGGSGGLAASKEAARLGAKTVCFDLVKPSTQGTTWGLGGTCVNVGCVPKKLFHFSSRIGVYLRTTAPQTGWNINETNFSWETMRENVNNYIRSLNFSYRTGLRKAGVQYVNAYATFKDEHTLEYTLKGEVKTVTAKYILIAVGGRPAIPIGVLGAAEHCITSDDLFWLEKSPGKTLILGASYIALECAGFLLETGCEVTVAVRSILLRGFDRQCAEKVGSMMEELGCKFYWQTLPSKIKLTDDKRKRVTFSNGHVEEFDTVMYAIGRRAATSGLKLENANVQFCDDDKRKIIVNDDDTTNVAHIFAVGDVAKGRIELTPTAIKAGTLLVNRLFGNSTQLMDYKLTPTVVFTPFEYGCIGYSEEDAISKFGEDDIEIFLSEFNSLEASGYKWKKCHVQPIENRFADEYLQNTNLSKLIVHKSTDRVIGFHCVGLHAGETTQGYALALLLGATKRDFDNTISIHPTAAESFHSLEITKRSGVSWVASGGCGGGKCG